MKNKYKIILIICVIIGISSILVGSIAYYRIVVEGSIKGSTGNAVFVLKDENSNVWNNKEINLGKVNPGDSGEFTVTMDASGSTVDMYATLELDRGTLPTNLKFYTTPDHKSELHKYYSFLEKSGTNSETLTIYWYWNPYISDEEDNKFINVSNLEAKIKVSAVQISEYAVMKNGHSAKSEFWNNTYKPYIRTITFGNDLSNLSSSCTEENLCWDISESATQKKKVYAYLMDSGLKDEYETEQSLYNLYIVSEAPIFAPTDCSYLFAGLNNITSINFNDNFNTSKVTNMSYMFGSGNYRVSMDNVIQILDLSSFNTSNVTNMSCMFLGYRGLLKLNIDNFNTSKVTDMSGMFSFNSSLTNLDLSSFNTSKVTLFGNDVSSYGMFQLCSSLISLDLSSFNTSNVTNMYGMFSTCSSLTNLDLSNFNTSNVTTMRYMFSGCSSLTSLNLSNFNTSKVTDMYYMFNDCSSIISLDLSNFATKNDVNVNYMFSGCSSLISLDLSGFSKLNGDAISGIFAGCISLKYLDISNLYFDLSYNYQQLMTLKDSSNLITTFNLYQSGSYFYYHNYPTPSNGKIIFNYTSNAEEFVDEMIAAHPDYNWVKGKLITAPSSN
ncbi:MAG: BspA family leucine-rich repeat surface protein [Firmicutes bacterium]|nr:BspA family leucine-rich repeat surface protein [Bacillota bacterium]